MADVRRGFVPGDEKEFNEENIRKLRIAQEELLYLLEHGYPIKSASTFVGNHHLLSERQRLAVVRATAEKGIIEARKQKQITGSLAGESVFIDGLNIIITLEVALSGSTLIYCMDHTMRDLAGLRGTYRLIDHTDRAILLIGDKLKELKVKEVRFYLDAPVSNTGRLLQRIYALLADYPFQITVDLANNPDVLLEKQQNIISSDAIILNKCTSYINLAAEIIMEKLPEVSYVDLSR